MDKTRIIGIELVVDDKGTTKIVRFGEEAKKSFGQASTAANGLDGSLAKTSSRSKSAEGAMAQLERRAGTLTGKMVGAGNSAQSAGAMFKQLAGTLGIAFSVQSVIAWANKVDTAHASYQKNLSMVSTMLDRSSLGQEKYNRLLQEYGTGLDDLSVKFGESTGTLSKGLYDILSASVAPSKALAVLKTSAEAARAGFTDTAVSVDFITSALNAYGKSADEAGQVSDIAFATVARGKTTFAELAGAVGQVAPTAAAANISLEQLMAMLANLTRQGINTNESVTAINALLVQFARGSEGARKAWEQITKGTALAGSEFSVARLRGEELFKTLEVLAKATDSQRMAILQEITAVKAANAMSQDSKGLREDLAKTNGALGQTQEALGKRMGESDLIAKQFDQTIERLWKNLGTRLAPAVDQARSNLTELFSVLNRALEKDSFGDFLTRLATGFSVPLDLSDAEKQLARAQKQLAELSAMPSWLPSWYTTDSNQAKALRAQIATLQEYIRTAKEAAQAVKSLGSGPLFPGDDTIQGALSIIGTDSTKADTEALAKLEKKLADEVAKASLSSFEQRERALNEFVAAYAKAGGDIKKIEGDLTVLRAANDRARAESSNAFWLQIGAAAAKSADEDEARQKKLTENERAAALAMAQYTGDSLKVRAIEHDRFIEEWKSKGLEASKAEQLWAAKQVQVEKDAALAMAQYTGDSLAEQALEHEKFINDWIARGLERNKAEELWAAKTNQSVGALLTKMGQKWLDYSLIATESFKTALDSIQTGLHDFIYGAFTGELSNLQDIWTAFWKSLANIAASILSQIGTGLIAKGLGSLFSSATTGAAGAAGSGLLGWLSSAAASALGALGFKSAAAWLGGSTAASAAGGTTAAAAFVPNAGTGGFIAAGGSTGANTLFAGGSTGGGLTAGGSTGSTASTASLSALFATPAGAMIAGILPGMVGAIFHDQINSLLGEGGPMTPEEAISNWEGSLHFLNAQAEALKGNGAILSDMTGQYGYFSETAKEAWGDFRRLYEVAGLNQKQLDDLYNSLDPVTQKLLDSGRVATGVEDDIRALAKAIARGREEFDWSKETIAGYQEQIDALAAKYGLTGAAAEEFSNKIWNLSQEVNSSSAVMVESGDAVKSLADDVVGSLQQMAGSADGITALTTATGSLVDAMGSLADQANRADSAVSGIKGSNVSLGSGSGVDVYHAGGLVRHSGGGIGNWGWVSYQELMRLAGDEVLTKLRLGEYVVQAGAVNALTMPYLEELNDTGSPPVLAAPVPVPVATVAPGNQDNRQVIIQEGAVVVVVQGGELDEDELALRLRDRLAELARDAFTAV